MNKESFNNNENAVPENNIIEIAKSIAKPIFTKTQIEKILKAFPEHQKEILELENKFINLMKSSDISAEAISIWIKEVGIINKKIEKEKVKKLSDDLSVKKMRELQDTYELLNKKLFYDTVKSASMLRNAFTK